jgi:hypothetical protein
VSSEEEWARAAVTASPAASSSSTTSTPDLTIKVGDVELTVVIGSVAGAVSLLVVALVMFLTWRFYLRGW